jgi:hypothetical protein
MQPPLTLTSAFILPFLMAWLGGATGIGEEPAKARQPVAEAQALALPQDVIEVFERLSTWGVSSVKGLAPVRVFTGGSVQTSTKGSNPSIALGFLVKRDGPRFTIVNTILQEEEYEEKAVTKVGGKIGYEEISMDEFARRHRERGRADSADHLWLIDPEIQPDQAARQFMLAWLCWQQDRPDLSERFASEALVAASGPLGKGESSTVLQKMTPFLSHHLFELELMRFGDPRMSRTQLVERLKAFAARFPKVDDSKHAEQLVIGLRSLIAEERDHPYPDRRDLSQLPPEEQARVLVEDCATSSRMFNPETFIFPRRSRLSAMLRCRR